MLFALLRTVLGLLVEESTPMFPATLIDPEAIVLKTMRSGLLM